MPNMDVSARWLFQQNRLYLEVDHPSIVLLMEFVYINTFSIHDRQMNGCQVTRSSNACT